MTAAGPGELIRIDGHLNATKYIDILENSLLPALQMMFGEAELYFVHDKSPIHMSRATTNCLDQQEKLNAIPWPAKGADMNPIENLWANLTSDPILATTPDELWDKICLRWEGLRRTNTCQVLIESMPDRLAQAIDQGGFWSKY